MNGHDTPKQTFCQFDEIFVTGCTGSCQNYDFLSSCAASDKSFIKLMIIPFWCILDDVVIWKVPSLDFIIMLIHGIIMASLRGLLNATSQLWDDRPVWLRAQPGVPDIERPTGGLAVPHNMATGRWRRGEGGIGLGLQVLYCFTNCTNNILGCFSTVNILEHFTTITSNRTRQQCTCEFIDPRGVWLYITRDCLEPWGTVKWHLKNNRILCLNCGARSPSLAQPSGIVTS